MEGLDFNKALKYPFNRWKGLLNIFWAIIPIVGAFALFGYMVKIVKSMINGGFEQLPEMSFGEELSTGFFMFLKYIPFVIVLMIVNIVLAFIPIIGQLLSLAINLFIVPVLVLNFIKKETIASLFEFAIIEHVLNDIVGYLIAILKTIGLTIIYVVLCFVLVGIPALSFGGNIFLADWFRNNIQ